MKSPKSQYHISERFFKGHVQRRGLWIRAWWRVAACCSCLGYQSLTARCSLIAAAVTGACITHLSELLSSAHLLFRRKSPPQSQHLRAHRTPLQDERREHAHAGDGDKSWLSRFPSVSHSAESHLPLTDGSAGRAAVLSGDRDCGTVRFSPVIRMESRSVVPKLWGSRQGTLRQGGQVIQGGLTGSEPLNHSFAPTQLGRPVLHTDPIFSVYISVLPAPPFCPHNGISFSDTNLKSSFNSAGWVSIPWLFPQGMSRGLSYIIRFLSPALKMGVIRN